MKFSLHNRSWLKIHVRETLWFHPLQCTTCDICCSIYYIRIVIHIMTTIYVTINTHIWYMIMDEWNRKVYPMCDEPQPIVWEKSYSIITKFLQLHYNWFHIENDQINIMFSIASIHLARKAWGCQPMFIWYIISRFQSLLFDYGQNDNINNKIVNNPPISSSISWKPSKEQQRS